MMRARQKARRVPLLLIFLTLTSFFQAGQSVWSLSIPNQAYIVGTVRQFCYGLGLSRDQAALCSKNRELILGVRYGANLAAKQCEYQFQYRRWNCSVPEKDRNSFFRRITGKGTREAAFTYAISSAGVAYSIARKCAVDGNLSACGCSRERRPKEVDRMAREEEGVQFDWGGCGDNIQFGAEFAKQFLNAAEEDIHDLRETREQERRLMNFHNNDVGIQAVRDTSKIVCKCHGITGSCNFKTCLRVLAEFVEIGDELHKKYDNAVQVKLERRNAKYHFFIKRKREDSRRDSWNRRSFHKKPGKKTLVFLKDPPNYCVRTKDFPGTAGRFCSIDSYGVDSCEELCCQRGSVKVLLRTEKRCRCKFHWCCEIRCKTCLVEETKHRCT